jgi:hypothetical protein
MRQRISSDQRIFPEEGRDGVGLWAVGTGWDRLVPVGEMFLAMPGVFAAPLSITIGAIARRSPHQAR